MSKYFMPGKDDNFLSNIITWARTGKRFRPSFPRAVQFQTLSTCNAKCIFCPHSSAPDEIIHGRMDDALIAKILDECKKSTVGRVSPYLTNEPLQDKRMPKILRSARQRTFVPIKTKINTNGALLTQAMGKELIEAGLSQLWISVNGYSPETYKASMGLDFEKTMTNVNAFLELKKTMHATRPKVIVTTIKTQLVEHELEGACDYWAARDVDFRIHALDNRVGESTAAQIRPGEKVFKRKRNCDLFLKQAYIVENGDMIICCHDWKQTVVVGNVKNTSIAEVWNSKRFKTLIYEYYADDFTNMEICRNCG